MPRVFLDANILLNGALAPFSHAGLLTYATNSSKFVTADGVLYEVDKQIEKFSRSKARSESAKNRVSRYVRSLGLVALPGLCGKGMTDSNWIEQAKASKCDLICTYNVKDFSQSGIRLISPSALLGDIFRGVLYPVKLNYEGTLFFSFSRNAPMKDFVLLSAENGCVVLEENGRIRVIGEGSTNNFNAPVRNQYELTNLVFSYRCGGNFEAIDFTEESLSGNGGVAHRILTMGRFALKPPIQLEIRFGPNSGFIGMVTLLAGLPKFLPRKVSRNICMLKTPEIYSDSISTEGLLEIWSHWEPLGLY